MNKQWKVEKKKAQYENRIRALEDQVYKLQCLVKEQHATILYFKSELDAREIYIKELSTIHTPYQSQMPQSSMLPTHQESIETTPVSDLELQIPETHTDQVQAQNT